MLDIAKIARDVILNESDDIINHISIGDGETIDTTDAANNNFEDTLSGIIDKNPAYDISDLSDTNRNGCKFDGVAKDKIIKVNNESYLVRVTVRKL